MRWSPNLAGAHFRDEWLLWGQNRKLGMSKTSFRLAPLPDVR